MNTHERLESAVQLVNTFNRSGAKPIVEVVSCIICAKPFASQVQDAELARRRGLGRICSEVECQNEARRRRQRGERRAQDDLRKLLNAILSFGGARMGVPTLHLRQIGKDWSATEQRGQALDEFRELLGFPASSLDACIQKIDASSEAIPVKSLFRRTAEAIYPLFQPNQKSKQEQDEIRAFEKLGPVAWELKAELERNIERPGDWVPQLRQIWPETGAEAQRKAR